MKRMYGKDRFAGVLLTLKDYHIKQKHACSRVLGAANLVGKPKDLTTETTKNTEKTS